MEGNLYTGEQINKELSAGWDIGTQKSVTNLIYEVSNKTGKSIADVAFEVKKLAASFDNLGERFKEFESLFFRTGPKRNPFEERNKHTQARALRAKAKQKKRLAKKRK